MHGQSSRSQKTNAAGFSTVTKKSLGQHFLHERGVIEKIVLAVDPQPGDRLIEIGPGQGALTLPLLDRHRALTAIEFDRDLLVPLANAAIAHGELTLLHANVLDVDLTLLANTENLSKNLRLVGNLPYNLSSPILFHALHHADVVSDMHFMLQKEVVDRMAASPGSKIYGRLSVMLQAFCTVVPLFIVAPDAFRPPPKVDSAVVRLIPLKSSEIDVVSRINFADIVRAAFGQRRKTLRNALHGVCDESLIREAGIDPKMRAEQLSVIDFVRLSNLSSAR